MNVVGCVLHQQGGELQQADSQRVQQVSLLLWVQDLGDRWERCGGLDLCEGDMGTVVGAHSTE